MEVVKAVCEVAAENFDMVPKIVSFFIESITLFRSDRMILSSSVTI